MTYYDWQITHSEVISWVSQHAGILIHQRDSRVDSLSELAEFWQTSENSVESERIPRTPDMTENPPALRTSPISLLYKEWTWEHYRKLNLTFFTLSVRRSTGVFIGGLSRCFGRNWGSGGPFIRPTDQLGWSGGQFSWPHWLWSLDTSCTDLPWHVGKVEFEKAPTPGWPAKEVGLAGSTLARLGPGFVPHHPLVSHSLWLCLILDIWKICMDFGPYDVFHYSMFLKW
jgi:hypothetical protein